jgi:hypothetical protein
VSINDLSELLGSLLGGGQQFVLLKTVLGNLLTGRPALIQKLNLTYQNLQGCKERLRLKGDKLKLYKEKDYRYFFYTYQCLLCSILLLGAVDAFWVYINWKRFNTSVYDKTERFNEYK